MKLLALMGSSLRASSGFLSTIMSASGTSVGVGELLAVVGDEEPESQGLGVTGEGPGDVSAAADHKLGRSGVRLDEVLDAVVGNDVLVPAHGHEAAGALDGVAVQGERAESPLGRTVLADQQLGADRGTQAVGRPDHAGERDGRSAGVGGVYLPGVVDVLVGAVHRVDEEEHRPAADEAVLGGEVFVQLVLAVLGVASSLH